MKSVADRAEAWRPWRGYATVHLWLAAADQLSQPDALRRSRSDLLSDVPRTLQLVPEEPEERPPEPPNVMRLLSATRRARR